MGFEIYKPETILAVGGTINFSSESLTNNLLLKPSGGAVTLLGNVVVNFTGTASDGQIRNVVWLAGFTLNGNTFTINGESLTDLEALKQGYISFRYVDGAAPVWIRNYAPNLRIAGVLSGAVLANGTTLLTALEDVTDGSLVAGGAANVATELTVAGVLTAVRSAATLVFSYAALSITNAAISATAAIARTKIASGTASHVLVNDGSGVMSSEAQLTASKGGTGLNSAGSTGVARVVAGTWSFLAQLTSALGGLGIDASASTGFLSFLTGSATIGAMTETLRCDVSFITAAQGTYYIRVPFPCTVTSAKARVTSVMGAADDGTITIKDGGGTDMTGGLITIPASSAHGTGVAVTITASNTLTANQEIQLLVAKTTTGGLASVDITITRTTLS